MGGKRASECRKAPAVSAQFVVIRSVTLVTNWLRFVALSSRLVSLGDFSKGQENHHVGRGT
jgi:hypothetical protein